MANQVYAQDRTVTGRVTADDGSPLPGVNIAVKGTTRGTTTNSEGTFSIAAPSGSILVFSFIGFTNKEVLIADQSVINVSLNPDVNQLQEVVVTALGIERNRNELAYSAQQVSADQITQARNVNFVNALSGKVAGLDIKTNNNMGGSTNVVIRGYKSITGNNQALFVIDGVPVSNANTNTTNQRTGRGGPDYGNAAADINPDNIASINVLKGAAATALYGSRAANGVIMITTKKGRKNSLDITINSGVTWGTIDKSTFARYQKEYGAGYEPAFLDATFDDGPRPTVMFTDDASYGPRFDPNQLVYQWDALDPFSPNYRKARPWVAAANDPSSFYETAVSSNQSIFISGGAEKATFKLGYTRNDDKGVLPNSKLDKNLLNLSASYDISDRLTVSASANYTNVQGLGRFGTGYSGRNPNQAFRQWWQTNVDIKEQREAYFRNRQNITWNWANLQGTHPIYSDNPYWDRYENFANDTRDHIFGYVTATYKVASWFNVIGRLGYDGTNDFQEERVAVGSAGVASYSRFNRSYSETNYDLILNFDKNISEDISFRGLLGSNIRRTRLNSIRASTNGGLVVPRLYSLSNSVSPIDPPTEEFERIGVDGIFANANFGYKELVFLELAARQDKSTTLPQSNNTYFYPSVGANFVFSNVVDATWLSHGKFRANYAEVGNDAPALSVFDVYDKPTGFGSTPLFSLPNTKNNTQLLSERTKSMEVGIEAEFFDSRVGLDVTYYKTNTFNQILPVNVTPATGFTARYINSGEVQNQGIEVSAFIMPIRTDDFSWTINANFARNRNKVISLYGEGDNRVTNVSIASLQGGVSLNAAEGHPYGVIRGRDYQYNDNGQRIVGPNGYYLRSSSSAVIIGNPNPDWVGGLNNRFRYKDLSLSFLIDVRKGGDFFSLDQWYGEATGLYPESAGLNELGNPSRTPVADGGGILLPGVQADGSVNTVRGENLDGYGQTPFGYVAGGAGAPHSMYIYDASFVKLRELALTYSLPRSLVEKLRSFKGIDVSLVGRNLWIIHKNAKYTDPEEGLSSGNAASGYQSGAYPAVRNYGFNVRFNF
ncbi:SusC/RagA family TonB-linked outer membrane protein [Telluribacter sp. SYSU D00476]|uniref:SusC/RagA family TonB-linked outer membrane protein n=1 Tax=Telluribacter sp. SYSU D00476 TaxID=2811430 RepID=UPI001FF67C6D|nr:SusC/RagA family TonB-linked outer membrane protein [Telluribacter sp. SYSU D00476]